MKELTSTTNKGKIGFFMLLLFLCILMFLILFKWSVSYYGIQTMKSLDHIIPRRKQYQKRNYFLETGDCLNSSSFFLVFDSGDYCIRHLIDEKCQDGLPVPNVVHYVLFNIKTFHFYNLLSFLSSYRKLKPCFIIIHGNQIPVGKWWNHLLKLVPNIMYVRAQPPEEIFGNSITVIQHKSDVARLQILMNYGGIYMDADQIALKSFNKLRKHGITLSLGQYTTIGNAVIIANKHSPFLHIWYSSYHTFQDKNWAWHSCELPFKLWKLLPRLANVEKINTFFGSTGSVYNIFKGKFDWSRRYGLHLYYRHQQVKDYSPEEIKTMNTTFGEVARFIYYGKKDIIK